MKLTSISIVLGLSASLVAIAAPAMAQLDDTQANPLADFETQNNDPFSGRGDASSSMMNLMHRLMQGERTDAATFNANQRDNMNDAMASFRAKQMQLIRARQTQGQKSTEAGAKPLPILIQPQPQTGALRLAPMTIQPLTQPAN